MTLSPEVRKMIIVNIMVDMVISKIAKSLRLDYQSLCGNGLFIWANPNDNPQALFFNPHISANSQTSLARQTL